VGTAHAGVAGTEWLATSQWAGLPLSVACRHPSNRLSASASASARASISTSQTAPC